jgi:tRNA pseudouridine38-40 synthase
VQDALEAALSRGRRCPTRVVCAGRTDAGVHALAQVVHFDTDAVRPDTAWVRGVNAHLPASVAVRWAQPVADDFMRASPRVVGAIVTSCSIAD